MDGEEYNNDLHAKKKEEKKRPGCANNIVNPGKNWTTETKVPDRTKGGREG